MEENSSNHDKELQIKARDDLLKAKEREIKLYGKRQQKLESSIRELEEELEIIQEVVREKDDTLRKQRLKIGDLEQEVKHLGLEVTKMKGRKQALHIAEKHNRDLLKILEMEEEKQESSSKEKEKLSQLLDRARFVLSESQEKSATGEAELRKTLKMSEDRRQQCEQETKEFKRKYDDIKQEFDELKLSSGARVATLEDEIFRRKEQHYKLLEKLQVVEDECISFKDKCSNYKESQELLNMHNHELTERLNRTQRELIETQTALREKQATSKEEGLLKQVKIESHEREKVQLQTKVEEMSNAILKLVARHKKQGETLSKAEASQQELITQVEVSRRAENKAKEQLRLAKEARSEAEAQRAAMKHMMDEMQTQMERLNERVVASGVVSDWATMAGSTSKNTTNVPSIGRTNTIQTSSKGLQKMDQIRRRLVTLCIKAASNGAHGRTGHKADLSETEVDDTDLQAIRVLLPSAPNIQKLDLSHNRLTDSGVPTLTQLILEKEQGPFHIDLRNNCLSMEGVRSIAEALNQKKPLGAEYVYVDHDGHLEGFRSTPAQNGSKKPESPEALESVLSVDIRENMPDKVQEILSQPTHTTANLQSVLQRSQAKEKQINRKRAARLRQAVRNKLAADVYDLSGKRAAGGTKSLEQLSMTSSLSLPSLSQSR